MNNHKQNEREKRNDEGEYKKKKKNKKQGGTIGETKKLCIYFCFILYIVILLYEDTIFCFLFVFLRNLEFEMSHLDLSSSTSFNEKKSKETKNRIFFQCSHFFIFGCDEFFKFLSAIVQSWTIKLLNFFVVLACH